MAGFEVITYGGFCVIAEVDKEERIAAGLDCGGIDFLLPDRFFGLRSFPVSL